MVFFDGYSKIIFRDVSCHKKKKKNEAVKWEEREIVNNGRIMNNMEQLSNRIKSSFILAVFFSSH